MADPDGPESCQFPYFRGTVGWKFGLEKYRDSPVKDDGTQITDQEQFEEWEDGIVQPPSATPDPTERGSISLAGASSITSCSLTLARNQSRCRVC